MQQLVVRLFLEVAQPADAETVAQRLEACMRSYGEPVSLATKPYWKIKEYTEVLLALRIAWPGLGAFEAAKDFLVADGWSVLSEIEALWDFESGGAPKLPDLRWAHLELHD